MDISARHRSMAKQKRGNDLFRRAVQTRYAILKATRFVE
jgi:hypothetical protein